MPWIVTRLPTTKPRLGPGGGAGSLYCATMPHMITRAKVLSRSNTACLHRAADILEIDVDPVRAGLAERIRQIDRAMVDAIVEAERLLHKEAFLRPAGDADHARAGALGELAGDGTDRARGGGDHHRLAGLRPAHIRHAGIGGDGRHAEHAEIGGKRRPRAVELHQRLRAGEDVALPAARADHDVAGREARIAGGDHLAHRLARHHAADRTPARRRMRLAQPAAHIGVDREPDRAGDDLARPGRRDRILDELEILRRGFAQRTAAQDDGAAGAGHGIPRGTMPAPIAATGRGLQPANAMRMLRARCDAREGRTKCRHPGWEGGRG